MKTQAEDHLQVAVVGGGSWATALIKILCENPRVRVRWWLRSEDDRRHIKKYNRNPSYLSAVELKPDRVSVYSDIREAVKGSAFVVSVVPAAFTADVLARLRPQDLAGKTVVSATKGMVPDRNQLITDYIAERFGVAHENMCVVAGPCHAEEVAMEKQSYLTIASEKLATARAFGDLLRCRYIKVNEIEDIVGVEYCAVMKNVIAIACGITHGLNYGDNFQAVLVCNAMQEIGQFLHSLSPRPQRDLNGSAYLGDLLVTAYSQFSRNRTFGAMIGKGYSVKSAQFEMEMIAEGYYAVRSVHQVNQSGPLVPMPVTGAVYNILYERISPIIEIKILLDALQ